MKKYFLAVLLLASFQSFGQFLNYTNINGRYKWIAGKFDSTFTIPVGTTPSLRTGGGNAPGALFYSTTDSTVYQYSGTQWTRLRGSDTAHVVSAYVRNTTASAMTPGQVVYINGSTGTTPTIALAVNKQDSTSAMTFGFVRGNIPVNGFGFITTFGPLEGVNTNAYDEGEVIYLDSIPGKFTHDKPVAPYHMVTLGYIIKKSGGNGTIYAKIQNGYELEELHNVRITEPVLNKSVIIYDSVRRLWVDTTVSAAGLGLGGSGTTNYVSKWTSSTALGNSIIFDNGTNVGINNASPGNKFVVSAASQGNVAIEANQSTKSVYFIPNSSGGGYHYSVTAGDASIIGYNSLPLNLAVHNGASIRVGTNLKFWGGYTATEQMTLTANGRLLLGTTTESTYELDVVGDIRSTLDANINGLTVGKGGGQVADNTAIGFEAINATATGAGNVAVGYRAGRAITSGVYNVLTGFNAGISLTTGSYNYAYGMYAARLLSSGAQNILIGYNAGAALTTQSNNVYIGHSAGDQSNASNNVAVGYQSGQLGTSGANNTSLGYRGGYGITTGGSNTAIGSDAGQSVGSGSSNVLVGRYAGFALTSSTNTAIGAESLYSLTSGANNTALGYIAGRYITAGTGNITSGNSVYLGYDARASADGNTNEIVIGYQARGNGSNSVTLGNSSVTKTVLQSGVLIGTSTSAGYALDVNGSFRAGNISSTIALNTGLIKFTLPTGGTSYYENGITLVSSGSSGNRTWIAYDGSNNLQIRHYAGLMSFQFDAPSTDFMRIGTSVCINSASTTSPAASAALDVTSTTKGFLPPRMTGTQAEAITSPAAGLMVYSTDGSGTTITSLGWWGYNGTTWVKLN
jgi:hypothetical protein